MTIIPALAKNRLVALVVAGDPLQGRIALRDEEFAERWRRCGIVLGKPKLER